MKIKLTMETTQNGFDVGAYQTYVTSEQETDIYHVASGDYEWHYTKKYLFFREDEEVFPSDMEFVIIKTDMFRAITDYLIAQYIKQDNSFITNGYKISYDNIECWRYFKKANI